MLSGKNNKPRSFCDDINRFLQKKTYLPAFCDWIKGYKMCFSRGHLLEGLCDKTSEAQ